jgi:hypothetical protein
MGQPAMDEIPRTGRVHGDQLLRRFDDWARTLARLRELAAGLPDDEGDLACARLAVITMRAYVGLLEPLLDEYPGPASTCGTDPAPVE